MQSATVDQFIFSPILYAEIFSISSRKSNTMRYIVLVSFVGDYII